MVLIRLVQRLNSVSVKKKILTKMLAFVEKLFFILFFFLFFPSAILHRSFFSSVSFPSASFSFGHLFHRTFFPSAIFSLGYFFPRPFFPSAICSRPVFPRSFFLDPLIWRLQRFISAVISGAKTLLFTPWEIHFFLKVTYFNNWKKL